MLLRQAEGQLSTSKGQIIALKKKLEEVEKAMEQVKKARDQAEQEGYDIGVAENEEALKAKVSRVCRNYCLQVWNEALTKLGLRLLQYLGRQRVYTTLLPFEHLARPTLGLMPPPRWQKWARPV